MVVLTPVFKDFFQKYPPVAYAMRGAFDHQRCEEVDPAITEELIPDIHAKVTERLESGHPTGTIYYGPPYGMAEFYQGVSEKNQRIARELGLTLHNFRSSAEELGLDIMRLERDIYGEEERPYSQPSSEHSVISVEEYFKITKEFLGKYDVSLELRHPPYHRLSDEDKDKIYDYEKMVQDNDMETKLNLYGLITYFDWMPEELVRATGLETIYLYNDRDFESPTGHSGFAPYNDPDAFYLNNADSQTVDAVHAHAINSVAAHEMGHAFDTSICGIAGSHLDKAYLEFNPHGNMQYHQKDTAISLSRISELNSNNLIPLADINKTVVVSDYGGTKIRQDKAEMWEFMFSPPGSIDGAYWLVSENSPDIIANKATLLLGRLAAKDIRLVEYILAATAPAPAKATPDQNTSE